MSGQRLPAWISGWLRQGAGLPGRFDKGAHSDIKLSTMSVKHYSWLVLWLVLGLSSVLAGLAACSSGAFLDRDPERMPANALNRADPGYMQYLEKQSMLGNSAEMAAVVSGSGLAWGRPGSGPRAADLLRQGAVWVHIHPQSVLSPGHGSPLGQLSGPIIWNSLDKGGIRGIYIAPTGGSGALWDTERTRQPGDNEDVIQYQFARYLGKDDDYRTVVRNASAFRGYLGGDLIPAATGIGPDFFLATRDFRNFPGLYCLVEVPKELWPNLPPIEKDGRVLPLSAEQAAVLEAKGLVPAVLQQQTLAYLPASGWAVTGGIRGIDGNLRRWVYRYFGDYKRPVLNWADPSAAARQVLNGSVIRQVGIFGNAFSGYRVLPFIGLERFDPSGSFARPNPESGSMQAGALGNYTLAMEAATNLSRQTRSYGGWSWLRDELPLPLLREFIDIGPDFVLDSVFSPGAEHALLTGDASLLRFMTDEGLAQKIDFKRLVHASAGHEGISYLLPHLEYLRSLNPEEERFHEGDARELLAKKILADKLYEKVQEQVREAEAGGLAQLQPAPLLSAKAVMGTGQPAAELSTPAEADLRVSLPAEEQKKVAALEPAGALEIAGRPEFWAAVEPAAPAASPITPEETAPAGTAPESLSEAENPAPEPAFEPTSDHAPDQAFDRASDQASELASEQVETGEQDFESPAGSEGESGATGSEAGDARIAPRNPAGVESPEATLDASSWDGRYYTTPAGIAVSALGLKAQLRSREGLTHEQQEEVARGHGLLVFFKAMQPGLLMLSGQDLVGLLPLTWRSLYDSPDEWSPRLATLGTYALLGSSQSVLVNSQGLPRGQALYGPLDIQSYNPESFLNRLGPLLRLRENLGLAEGELVGRLKAAGPGLVCLVSKLPEERGYAIALSNFSRNESAENLRAAVLPELDAALRSGKAWLVYGKLDSFEPSSTHLSFTIPGWEGALILVE